MWVRQARLPQRFGGCGLRDSQRTSHAAFWASWADTLPIIFARYPGIGHTIFDALSGTSIRNSDASFARALRESAAFLQYRGWRDLPSWEAIKDGVRPPVPDALDVDCGEWQHGW